MPSPRHLGVAFGFPWPDLFSRADDDPANKILRVRQPGKETKEASSLQNQSLFNWVIIIIIIIISLFQEDNIFGTNASLTYGPRLQR